MSMGQAIIDDPLDNAFILCCMMVIILLFLRGLIYFFGEESNNIILVIIGIIFGIGILYFMIEAIREHYS